VPHAVRQGTAPPPFPVVPDYDYAQAGAYFVTICAQDRLCLFGKVADDEMRLNAAGLEITRWWHELANKYPCVKLDTLVVMPNHLHGIIVVDHRADHIPGDHPFDRLRAGSGSPLPSLGEMVGWFQTMSTNAYIRGGKKQGWEPFRGRLWQRNYSEHIIRNDAGLDRARAYIEANPSRWSMDDQNPANPTTW